MFALTFTQSVSRSLRIVGIKVIRFKLKQAILPRSLQEPSFLRRGAHGFNSFIHYNWKEHISLSRLRNFAELCCNNTPVKSFADRKHKSSHDPYEFLGRRQVVNYQTYWSLFQLTKSNLCSGLKNLDNFYSCSESSVCGKVFSQQRFYCTKQSKVLPNNVKKGNLNEDTNNTTSIKKSISNLRHDVIWTVPNFLTTLRMVLAPVLGYLVLHEAYTLACGVFVVAGLTDLLDGFIARNFQNQTSALGSFIDPLADKLLISILFVSLTAVNLLPVALTVLVVARDICLMSAGFYVRYISLNPRPKSLGEFFDITNPSAKLQPTLISKVNTAVQLSVVAFSLAAPVFDIVEHPVIQALWYLTAATTVVSGVGYIFAKDTFKLIQQQTRKNS